MKRVLVFFCIASIISCARKTAPAKTTPAVHKTDTVSLNNNGNVFADSPAVDTSVAVPSATSVMIVADGYGRLITPKENLPTDAVVNYNNLQLSKGFTTQQRANLQARYKTVPPRVLYVPQQYSSNSLKGVYYVYKKKFWYWKQSDGLFYLDQKYYL